MQNNSSIYKGYEKYVLNTAFLLKMYVVQLYFCIMKGKKTLQ